MTVVFVMDDGFELKMKCEKFTVEKNGLGQMVGWTATGVTENKPLYMPIEYVKMIYRVCSDEAGGKNDD